MKTNILLADCCNIETVEKIEEFEGSMDELVQKLKSLQEGFRIEPISEDKLHMVKIEKKDKVYTACQSQADFYHIARIK